MIRDSLSPSSQHAMTIVSAGKGVAMQYRGKSGDVSGNAGIVAGAAPVEVWLSRTGNSIGGWFVDASGSHSLGSALVPMGATVYVGLAVTSHDNTKLATAVFDQFRIDASQ